MGVELLHPLVGGQAAVGDVDVSGRVEGDARRRAELAAAAAGEALLAARRLGAGLEFRRAGVHPQPQALMNWPRAFSSTIR